VVQAGEGGRAKASNLLTFRRLPMSFNPDPADDPNDAYAVIPMLAGKPART
jgi:hypothetical protein